MTQIFFLLLALVPAPQSNRSSLGITVYADENFRGKSATFRENTQDLRPFGLTDKATSLRVAPGEAWEVCEHINYEGRCRVFTGDVRDLRDEGFNDIISSVRRVADYVPPSRGRGQGRDTGRPELELFEGRDFRGPSMLLTGDADSLRQFSNRVGSVRVISGEWEICDLVNYRGRCRTVSRDVADVRSLDLGDGPSSARPIRR